MLKSGDVLNLDPLGMKMYVKKVESETNRQSFAMEIELRPQTGGTPVHIHPHATETYEVLQGSFDVFKNGVWKTLSTGEKVVVEMGVPHTFRDSSDDTTRVYNVHQPAMRYGEYFEGLARLANSGVIKSNQMTFTAILHLSILMTTYKDEMRSVNPPYQVMRLFAGLGRLLGYTA